MKNQYETVFILTPVLSESQVKEAVDRIRNYILDNGGEIVWEEDWGLKKLAYPIQHKKNGFYHLIEFKYEPDKIDRFDLELKRDEKVIRHLIVKLDKHAIAWNEKRRKRMQQKAESPEGEKEEQKNENA
ncbi:MAG: 30S ribosomal protein S6 [Chlorobi bacterium]|nr:30S ribosomal protein S6 [Chlorobiota bacterium]